MEECGLAAAIELGEIKVALQWLLGFILQQGDNITKIQQPKIPIRFKCCIYEQGCRKDWDVGVFYETTLFWEKGDNRDKNNLSEKHGLFETGSFFKTSQLKLALSLIVLWDRF